MTARKPKINKKLDRQIVVCDIDATIADIGPRLAVAGLEPDRKNKRAFQDWLDKVQSEASLRADKPIAGMAGLLNTLKTDYDIVYLTGRTKHWEPVTREWLSMWGFPLGDLIMRPNYDSRSAADYKRQKLLHVMEKGDILVVLDDDGAGDCAKMYRELGLTHLKQMNRWDIK